MEFIKGLPIFREFRKVEDRWNKSRHLILKAPTGSGKSIALPYLLKKNGLVRGKILILQPRRIAARMLALHLSRVMQSPLGKKVGYHVRFDRRLDDQTEIIYATDGVILKYLLNNNFPKDIELLIMDEFHERSVQIDLSLALCLKMLEAKTLNFRLLVASATLNSESLIKYIPDSSFLEISGRSYPVQIEYRARPTEKPIWKVLEEIIPKLLKKLDGDILVFLDGFYEITKTIQTILSCPWSCGLEVRSLYGELSTDKQDFALQKSEKRKVIISTNIAETSLTIEGIKIVVDAGSAKKMHYDRRRGINSLLSEPISKSSADQRAGRAGRITAGYCLRLWSEAEHKNRAEFEEPEIKRIDLSEIYLNLTAAGLSLERLELLEKVSDESIKEAKLRLQSVRAIDQQNQITEHGLEMSKLPLHPSWSHALLVARKDKLVPTISLILALLQVRSIVQLKTLDEFYPARNPRSDLYCLLLAFEEALRRNFDIQECNKLGIHAGRCRESEELAKEFCKLLGIEFCIQVPQYEMLSRILIKCFPQQIAKCFSEGRNLYKDFHGRHVHLNKSSVLKNEKYILPLQIIEKKIKGRIVLEAEWSSGLDEDWIRDALSSQITYHQETTFDPEMRKVIARKIERWGNLELSVSQSDQVDEGVRAHSFAKALMIGDLKLKRWNTQVEKFLNRKKFLYQKFPDLGVQEMNDGLKLLFFEQLCQGVSTIKEIKNLEVYAHLVESVSKEEREILDNAVPETFDLGMGKRPYTLDYSKPGEVILFAKLQDLFDVSSHPTIVFGKYPLIVEILAPNQRTVQRTSNLPDFWDVSYHSIRKELAGRYPKHEWR